MQLAEEKVYKVCGEHKQRQEILKAYMALSDASEARGTGCVGRAGAGARERLTGTGESGGGGGGRGVLLDEGSESARVGTLKRIDEALVLEEEEGGHGTNTVSLRNGLHSIDVDLKKDGVGILSTPKFQGTAGKARSRVKESGKLKDPT